MYGYKFNKQAPYDIISNNFLSIEDINNIHIVEDAFEKFYNKTTFKKAINYILDNIANPFEFFFNLGSNKIPSSTLEETFKYINDYVKDNINLNYDEFHQLLILDYLNYHNIKPSIWWDEKLSTSDRNILLREIFKTHKITNDINILYKYSLVIQLKETLIIAIYKDNKKEIHIITN